IVLVVAGTVAMWVGGCDGFFESPHSAVATGNEALAVDDVEAALELFPDRLAVSPPASPS
ncbi:MAG: hypothetical protein QGI33_06680, partial [Candidatus Brocadiia bacterium]|nr:hypothetical protein [Candidatus Brocadiia bacterium]